MGNRRRRFWRRVGIVVLSFFFFFFSGGCSPHRSKGSAFLPLFFLFWWKAESGSGQARRLGRISGASERRSLRAGKTARASQVFRRPLARSPIGPLPMIEPAEHSFRAGSMGGRDSEVHEFRKAARPGASTRAEESTRRGSRWMEIDQFERKSRRSCGRGSFPDERRGKEREPSALGARRTWSWTR